MYFKHVRACTYFSAWPLLQPYAKCTAQHFVGGKSKEKKKKNLGAVDNEIGGYASYGELN